MKRSVLFLMLVTGLIGSGCQSVRTTSGGAIGVSREQRMAPSWMLSEQQVEQMAAQGYAQSVGQARQGGRLNSDSRNFQRLNAIAKRLIPHTAVFRSDALNWKWEVNLETRDELNAYCAPGGKIMFFTGIINRLSLTDDEIAAIMGHEMAHALREHGREAMSREMAKQMGMNVLAMSGKVGGQTMQLLDQGTGVFLLKYSRENETEADRIGLELMARGGYDPTAAISLWRKMAAASGGEPPAWLSTHPSNQGRQKDLSDKIPLVMPLYQQAKKGR